MRLLVALALLLHLGGTVEPAIPELVGRASWYGEPAHLFRGNYTKGGELWDADAMTCAVDIDNWERYRRERLLVCSGIKCIVVAVSDTGYLARAGVALDLTPAAFVALFGSLEQGVGQIRAYVMEGEG